MRFKSIAIIGTLPIVSGLAVFSYPAMAACVFADGNNIPKQQLDIIQKAKSRIRTKFGPLKSQPTVYFFDDANSHWPLRLNSYGSTSFLGYKTCVAIGPDGQNVDVVAHEFMHAEIVSHTGYLSRIRKLPTWFDEGLAMQVDFRERYDLKEGADISFITRLNSNRTFSVSDRELSTKHYAAAKATVKIWLSRVNENDVYGQLSKLREGSAFDSIWQAEEK